MDSKKRKAAEMTGGATPQAQQKPSKRLKAEPAGSMSEYDEEVDELPAREQPLAGKDADL